MSAARAFTDRPYLLSIVLAAAMAVSTIAGTLIGVLGAYLRDEVGGVTARLESRDPRSRIRRGLGNDGLGVLETVGESVARRS